MPQASKIFASSRISALEHQLLSRERLRRMLDAESPEEAVKVLYEVSYAEGMTVDSAYDYERLLEREMDLTDELIHKITPDAKMTDCFFLKNDVHNAKVFFKKKYGNSKDRTEDILYTSGTLDRDFLASSIASDSYAFLPSALAEACRNIDSAALNGTITPGYIDLTLDKAMAKELSGRLGKVSNPLVRKYFAEEADLANLAAVYRLKRLDLTVSEAEEYLIPGGTIALSEWKKLISESRESVAEHFRYTPYRDLANRLSESVTEFERERDNRLLGIFRARKNELFTADPVAGFYLAKKSEAKNIRIIMTALLNRVEKEIAEKRLRETYGS